MAPTRILLVEDSPTQVEATRACLRREGFDLRVAGTAADALATAEAWRPDAVLLDIGLPDATGFDVMRRLRGLGLDPPVIIVTANGSVGTAVEAMRQGARDFVVKPFARARLIASLDKALQRQGPTGPGPDPGPAAIAAAGGAAPTGTDARGAHPTSANARGAHPASANARGAHPDAGDAAGAFAPLVGQSAPMCAVRHSIAAVAPSRVAVFITGESGTGKELAAEALHRASPRAAAPFVALNCAAIPRDLLESEIFGHARGAFTGATTARTGAARAAHGGTLFLDEICEMPPDLQAKLLRFVQTGRVVPIGATQPETVDVRFVSATNRDPLAEVKAGRFREDLFYRLYVVPIEMPPLRERGDDVLLIARDLLARASQDEGRRFRDFAPEVAALLRAHPWPGNVRQLQNVIRNIVVLHDAEVVTPAMLPQGVLREATMLPQGALREAAMLPQGALREAAMPAQGPQREAAPAPCEAAAMPAFPIMPMAEMERRLIEAALAETGQDVVRAAVLLQVSPSTIYRRLQTWRSAAVVPGD